MEKKATNIYPIFDRMMSRDDKEQLLKQRGMMLWFTGLSGSGKSTVAIALERELHSRGLLCRILDGDNIRSGSRHSCGRGRWAQFQGSRADICPYTKECAHFS